MALNFLLHFRGDIVYKMNVIDENNRQKDNSSPTISERPSIHNNGKEFSQNPHNFRNHRENPGKIEQRETRPKSVNKISISKNEIDIAYRSAQSCLRLLSADSLPRTKMYRNNTDSTSQTEFKLEKHDGSYTNNFQRGRNRSELKKSDENRRKLEVIYANVDTVRNTKNQYKNVTGDKNHNESPKSTERIRNGQKEGHVKNHVSKNERDSRQGFAGQQQGLTRQLSPNFIHEIHENRNKYGMPSQRQGEQQVPEYNYEYQSHKENLRLERKQSFKEGKRLDRNSAKSDNVTNREQKGRVYERGQGENHRNTQRNKVIQIIVNETNALRSDQDSHQKSGDSNQKSGISNHKAGDNCHKLQDNNPKLRDSNHKSRQSCTRLLSPDMLNVTQKDRNANKLEQRKLKLEQEKQPESWYQYRNNKGELEWKAKYPGEKCENSERIYANLVPRRSTSAAPSSTAGIKCVGKAITLLSERLNVNPNNDLRKSSELNSPAQMQKGIKSDILNTNDRNYRTTPVKCIKSKLENQYGEDVKSPSTTQPKIVNLPLMSPIQEKYKVKHKRSEVLTLENIDLLNQSFNDSFVNVSQNRSPLNASLVNDNKQKVTDWLDNLNCTEDSLQKMSFTELDSGNSEGSLEQEENSESNSSHKMQGYRKEHYHRGLNRSERESFDDSFSKPPSKRFKTGNKDTGSSIREIHKLSAGFIAKTNSHAFHERFKGMSKREVKAFLENDESGVSSLINLKPKSNALYVDDYSSFPGSPETDLEVVSWDGVRGDPNVYLDQVREDSIVYLDKVRGNPNAYLDQATGDPNVYLDQVRGDPNAYLDKARGDLNACLDKARGDPDEYLGQVRGNPTVYLNQVRGNPNTYLDQVREDPNAYLDQARGDPNAYLDQSSPVSDKLQYELPVEGSLMSPNARQSRESMRNMSPKSTKRDRSARKIPYSAVSRTDKRVSSAPSARREVYPLKRVTSYFGENLNDNDIHNVNDNHDDKCRVDRGREINTIETLMSPVAKHREQFEKLNVYTSNDNNRVQCRQEEKIRQLFLAKERHRCADKISGNRYNDNLDRIATRQNVIKHTKDKGTDTASLYKYQNGILRRQDAKSKHTRQREKFTDTASLNEYCEEGGQESCSCDDIQDRREDLYESFESANEEDLGSPNVTLQSSIMSPVPESKPKLSSCKIDIKSPYVKPNNKSTPYQLSKGRTQYEEDRIRQDSPCTSMAKLKINTPRSRRNLERSPFANNDNRNHSSDFNRRSFQSETNDKLMKGRGGEQLYEHNSNVLERKNSSKITIPTAERPLSRLSNETFTIEPVENEKENYLEPLLVSNNQRSKSKKSLFTVVGKNNIDKVRQNTEDDKVRPENKPAKTSSGLEADSCFKLPVSPPVQKRPNNSVLNPNLHHEKFILPKNSSRTDQTVSDKLNRMASASLVPERVKVSEIKKTDSISKQQASGRHSRQGDKRSETKPVVNQFHYAQSTPVRPGVRLSLNETFSTIVGTEETEMEQDEEVMLIDN